MICSPKCFIETENIKFICVLGCTNNYICHFLMKIKAEKQFSSSGHQKSGFEDFPQRFFEFGAKLSSYSIVLLVFVASLM